MKKFLIFVSLFIIPFSSFSQRMGRLLVKDYLPEGHVTDGSVNYRDILQKLLNSSNMLIFPPYPLLIDDKGLQINSNQTLVFEEGSKLILEPTDKGSYAILDIVDVSDVLIEGVYIQGDKNSHLGSTGEWGMGINIKGSSNVKIKNSIIEQCWGDGIYISRNNGRFSEDVVVENCIIRECRRNGISIISGKNLSLSNLSINSIYGTLPEASIDIEPNSDKDQLGNISINSIISENSGIGLQIGLSRYPSQINTIDIFISDFKSLNDGVGFLFGDFFREYPKLVGKLQGQISVSDFQIYYSKVQPLKFYNVYGYKYSPILKFTDLTIFDKKEKGSVSNSKIMNDFRLRGFVLENLKINI